MAKNDDHDSPWKEILEGYFPQFMVFFFPQAYDEIDWQRKPIYLDKELQSVTRKATIGRRLVDKLVKVWRNTGEEIWVLIHVEVQGQEEANFSERMYVYHNRLFDKYRCSIMSLAVLSDENLNWQPHSYHRELWNSSVHFKFPIIKLTKQLYQRGFTDKSIRDLYRFIDWMLQLPETLDQQVWQQIKQFEEETHMTYISYAERVGHKQGLEAGLQQGLERGLEQGLERGLEQGKLKLRE